MNAYQIISRKRDGKKLAAEEILWFIAGISADKIPDYQTAALLMAIYLQGMDFEETAALTQAMLQSGMRMNLAAIPGCKIDKHSTGGVGDKISLILAPLVAAAGVRVPMISGRGLGHSGGTLDKLESIPGFRTRLSVEEFYQQIEKIGVSIIGQTEQIAPADKKMYALRDATATIESIPLITASILSKKLAEGIDGLVLDVKTGRGAFMKTEADARALAESLVRTAALNGLPTTAVITRMDEPLGYAVGNWLEIVEVIRCLQGDGAKDVMQVTLTLGAEMLRRAKITDSVQDAHEILTELIDCGAAFSKFCEMVEHQGGDVMLLQQPNDYLSSKCVRQALAEKDGFITGIDSLEIGRAVVDLGGGRRVMEDQIDHKAGLLLSVRCGDAVRKGQALAMLLSDRESVMEGVSARVAAAFVIKPEQLPEKPLIVEIMRAEE
jgi:pyrimidine-nucleoside phosphorylase